MQLVSVARADGDTEDAVELLAPTGEISESIAHDPEIAALNPSMQEANNDNADS